MKARACCLSVRGLTSGAVRKALVCDAGRDLADTFRIFNPEARAAIIAKIEFREIAIQMLFADVVERSDHATLENGKIVFSAVDMDEAAEASIFVCRMVHGSVTIKFFAELRVSRIFVGRQI